MTIILNAHEPHLAENMGSIFILSELMLGKVDK